MYYTYVCLVVYTSLGYCDVVLEATEASMGMAVHEVKETPHYQELYNTWL